MADLTQAYDALKKADAAGNTADAKRLADYIRDYAPPKKENEGIANDKPPEMPGALDLLDAGIGPAASMTSSAVLQPVAGLAGLGVAGANALGMAEPQAADVVRKIQGWAYQPQTTGGKNAMQAVGAIPNAIEEGIRHDTSGGTHALERPRWGGAGTKPSGEFSPGAKTVAETLLSGGAQLAGGKGAVRLAETPGILTPKPRTVSPTIRDLASKGVVTTPGMRGGKIASAVEQRASSIPGVGDMIKRARGKATEQWNRAELNEAIKDAGGTEIPANRTGRDAIAHTEAEMQTAYTRVLGKMKGDLNSADTSGVSFRQFLQQTEHVASNGLDKREAKIIDRIVGDSVLKKFDAAGRATGENVKEIQETLRTEIDQLKGGTYQERKAAEVLKTVSAEMKAMLKRENPKLAADLDNIDRGYAKFKASSKAALYATKQEGHYTPAQKLRAIRDRDKSKDKQRFASGTAHGQREAQAVESVIGNTEPDSGTAGRIATMEALLAGVGAAAHHPVIAAGAMAAPAIYSQPVLKALQKRALGSKNLPATKTGALLGLGAMQPNETGIAQ